MRLPPIPELTSPLALAAVGLLALNDHVLKRAIPGPLTGKLSDIAGCFVLPLFLSATLAVATRWTPAARLAIGACATLAFFGALKVSAPVAHSVAHAIALAWEPLGRASGRIVADPTDLVALPFAAAAWAYGVRVHARRAREAR